MAKNVKINGEIIELFAKTIRFRVGDIETLETVYQASGGAGSAVRMIIMAHVDALRARVPETELGQPTPQPVLKE